MDKREKIARIGAILRLGPGQSAELLDILQSVTTEELPKTPDNLIREDLRLLGIPAGHKGYTIILDCCLMLVRNFERKDNLQRLVFDSVALRHSITRRSVTSESNTAIAVGAARTEPEVYAKFFGSAISSDTGIPSTKEFLCRIAEDVICKLNAAEERK